SPDPKAVAAAMIAHATPGEPHKKLDALVGEWTYTAKFWMDPSQPPMEMAGTSKRTWIMGGRFIQDEITNTSGMPFNGVGTTGYDNYTKKYVSTWIDSMSTSISYGIGEFDASGKVFTTTREDYCPMCGTKVKMRDVTRIIGPDTQVMEFYKTPPG